ncbi:dehydrogenase/reductase SDR family member 7-like [Phlebotomus papatasi]|uniref:dehydrogenase/reductase SDR family member 7-like n=1 Tax=Phlebotomus papatasi TaxID=29031 RepID=UPI0024846DE3|nr:dehydrogenase/reductase SDR family member 7-like [Phlebotomus papatasi]
MMFLFILAGIGLGVLIYYIVSVILWINLDCDVELFIKSKFGKKISSLEGKVVWITGASSGIGKSLALLLAKNGVKLALSARRLDELQKVKEDCLLNSRGKLKEKDILSLRMDVLEMEKHGEIFERVLKHFGRLDILVNNAGRSQRASWLDIDLEVDRAIFELNVLSPVNLSRIVARYFIENGIEGHIAVNASMAALIPIPNMSSYIAAKSAINGYFHALRVEYPQIKNTVYCVGPVFTNIQLEAFTAEANQKCGKPTPPTDKRLTSEKAAFYFAVAIANATSLNWAGLFPFTFLTYLARYPAILDFAMKFTDFSLIRKNEKQGK